MHEVGTVLIVMVMAYLFGGLVFLLSCHQTLAHTENPDILWR
jgi:hypothetical protein